MRELPKAMMKAADQAWEFVAPRIGGAIKVVTGLMEVYTGMMAASVVGPGTIIGALAILHGFDTILAGMEQLRTGEETRTLTAQLIGQATGSQEIGDLADMLIGTGLSMGSGAIANSARAGAQMGARGGMSMAANQGRSVATKEVGLLYQDGARYI